MASFNSALEASEHPVAAALFQIEGVTNVFFLSDFLTVTKHPEARWKKLQREVEAVLERHCK